MRNWLLPLLLLILGGWILTTTVQGAATSTPAPTPDPAETPELLPTISVTPTMDRLAAPPTAENPTQADEGAQLFWLHCQPCHGDVGQGLTEDWRQQYPPEDENCWASGCHGNRPYENGFTLPTAVPAVTGEDSLRRFETVEQLYGFIAAAMPYQDPGHLTEEEYLAITAFLARAHNVWDGTPLNPGNLHNFRLRPAAVTETPPPTLSLPESENNNEDSNQQDGTNLFIVGIIGGVLGSLTVIALLIKRRTTF